MDNPTLRLRIEEILNEGRCGNCILICLDKETEAIFSILQEVRRSDREKLRASIKKVCSCPDGKEPGYCGGACTKNEALSAFDQTAEKLDIV